MSRILPNPALLLSLVAPLIAHAAADPTDAGECYRQGRAARQAKQYVDARRLLLRGAELGNNEARYLVAIMLGNGEGGPVDRKLCRRYHTLASEAGDVRSMAELGRMMLDGDGGPADPTAGLAWLEKASGSDAFAAVRIAQCYEQGQTAVARDPARAAQFYEKAASQGLAYCGPIAARIRKALATSPAQKSEELRNAMTTASAAANPTGARAKAFSAYFLSLYESGLPVEAVGPAALHGLADLIGTDFYAVYEAGVALPPELRTALDRRLSADQREIITRLRLKAAGKKTEDPVVKPGQGWATAFPGGVIPRAAAAPVSAPAGPAVVQAAPPTPVYRVFRAYPGDYRRNLNGYWMLESYAQKGKNAREAMRFEMSGSGGYAYDAKGAAHPVSVTERDAPGGGKWVFIRVHFGSFTLKGSLHEIGTFDGDILSGAGTVLGNWTMRREVDLDYAAAGKTELAAYHEEYAAAYRIGAESRAARKAGDTKLADERGAVATEHLRRSEARALAAVHYYSEALRFNPSHIGHLYDRGAALYSAQRYAEAVADFDRMIATTKDESQRYQARYNRMLAHYYWEKHAEALVDADALLAASPPAELSGNVPQTHFMRGDILWWLDRRPESEAAYAKALELNPGLKDKVRAANTREGMFAVLNKTNAETNRILSDMNAATAAANRQLAEANRKRREGLTGKASVDENKAAEKPEKPAE